MSKNSDSRGVSEVNRRSSKVGEKQYTKQVGEHELIMQESEGGHTWTVDDDSPALGDGIAQCIVGLHFAGGFVLIGLKLLGAVTLLLMALMLPLSLFI